jgi:hypothetical protein
MPRICCAKGSAELSMVGGADEGAAAAGVEAGAAAGEGEVEGRIASDGSGDGTGDGAGEPSATDGGGLGAPEALRLCVVAARVVAARVARTSACTVP